MNSTKYILHTEDGAVVVDERTVSSVVGKMIFYINQWMAEQLTPTDYTIIKVADPTSGLPVPPEVQQARADIRAAGAAAKRAIAAAAALAVDDEDKAACDAIEAVRWS